MSATGCVARQLANILSPPSTSAVRCMREAQVARERRARRGTWAVGSSQAQAALAASADWQPQRSSSGAAERRLGALIGEVHTALREGQWTEAQRSFNQSFDACGGDLDAVEDTYSRLMQGLCRGGRLEEAEQTFKRYSPQGLRLTSEAGRQLVQAALVKQRPERAHVLFQALKKQGTVLSTAAYTDLISALAKSGEGNKDRQRRSSSAAIELWDCLRSSGQPLDVAAYTAGVGAFCRAGDLRVAEQLLVESAHCGISPGVRMYNQLIAAYGRRRDISGVQGKVREMRDAGIPPNEATHGSLVAALVRCGDLERAWFALKAGQRVSPPPGVRAYTALLQGLAAAARFDDCIEVLDDMRLRGVPPNVVTFTTLADGMVNEGRLEEARGLLGRMRAEGVQPNAVTYNTLLRGYAELGQLAQCFKVVEEMATARVQPSLVSYNTLLNACVQSRETEFASLALKQLRASGLRPDAVTYAALLKDSGLRGDIPEARRIFAEMCANPRVSVDVAVINAMLSILVGCGACEEAERLLLTMQECGCQPDVISFGTLVGGFAMQDDLERAERVLQRCRNALVQPDARMFDDMIDLCCRKAAFDRAKSLISEMEERGFQPDKLKYDRLLNALLANNSRGGTVVRTRKRSAAVAAPEPPSAMSEIERFKFWLGIPNKYYSDGADWRNSSK